MRHGSSSSSKLKALINMATTRITLESTALELREGRGGFGFPPARSRQMPPAGFSPLTLSCEALERSAFRLGLKNSINTWMYHVSKLPPWTCSCASVRDQVGGGGGGGGVEEKGGKKGKRERRRRRKGRV